MTVTRTPTGQELTCLICGTGDNLDIDHVVNRGMGGSKARDVPENKVHLCRPHHELKTLNRIRARVSDGLYEWSYIEKGDDPKNESNWGPWMKVPVHVDKRHKCLVQNPADEQQQISGGIDIDGSSAAFSAEGGDSGAGSPAGPPSAGVPVEVPLFGDARLPKRFWDKAQVAINGCWLWIGSGSHKGYGCIWWGGASRPAHLIAYEVLIGHLADGLQSDHLCRVRQCVNPTHIEPVTSRENTLRGESPLSTRARYAAITHCKRGHPFNEANTIHKPNGTRQCRTCKQATDRQWSARKTRGAEVSVESGEAESGHGSDRTQRTGLTMKKPLGRSLGLTEGSAPPPPAEAVLTPSVGNDDGEADTPPPTGPAMVASPSSFLSEDWTGLSDDDLQGKFDAADQMQGVAFLAKCKAVFTYRNNHDWGDTWTENAYSQFHVSRPTLYAYSNIWEIVSQSENLAERVGSLTDSRAVMQYIGRRNPKDGAVAMEAAIDYVAEFAQPPSVIALAEKLGVEKGVAVKRWTLEQIAAFKGAHENRDTAHSYYSTCPYCSVVDVLLKFLEERDG